MKQALILFAKSSAIDGKADPAALCSLLSDEEITADWAYLEDLLYFIGGDGTFGLYDTRNEREIQAYSAVYFRYWALQEGHATSAARICKILKVPFIDDETIRAGTRNKLSQYVMLSEAGIAIPRSLMGAPEALIKHYRRYNFTFPFIMKDKSGTRGQGNYLVHTEDEMREVEQANPDRSFILQDFIPNDGDYRVFVIGGKAKLLIQRKAVTGSHLNNISQGGSAQILPLSALPDEAIRQSEQAAELFGRDVAGVDLVLSKADGRYYCFEVNRAPQIEHASFEHEKADVLREYLKKL